MVSKPTPNITAAEALTSSAKLIRALKLPGMSSTDKVELARQAWINDDLYVPGKREVLLEWVVADMSGAGKGKGKEKSDGSSGPLLSSAHWSLLNQLLPTSSSTSSAPLPPATLLLLTSFLRQLPALPASSSSQTVVLFSEVSHTADRVLPLLRVSSEGLLDLFGDALVAWSTRSSASALGAEELEGWETLLAVLSKALERTLPNNLNRKKLSSTHLKSPAFLHLLNYLLQLQIDSALAVSLQTLQSSLLFPIEVLKTLATPPTTAPTSKSTIISTQTSSGPAPATNGSQDRPSLYIQLEALLASSPTATLAHLPSLFASYASLLSINRHTLFPGEGRGGGVPTEVHASEQVGKATLRFLKELKCLVEPAGSEAERCLCVKGLWAAIEERGRVGRGYEEGDEDWRAVGREEWEGGVARLEKIGGGGVAQRDAIIDTCTILHNLDHELATPFLSKFLSAIASIPSPHEPSFSFLLSLLAYYRQTKTLPTLLTLLLNTLSSTSATYLATGHGPLLGLTWLEQLGKAFATSLSVQGQIGEGLEEIKSAMTTLLEAAHNEGGDDSGEGRKKKKRRVSDGASLAAEDDAPTASGTAGGKLSLLSRIAKVYVTSSATLVTNNLPTQLIETLQAEHKALLIEVAIPLVEFGLGEEGAGGAAGREMVLSAGLRLAGSLRDVLSEEVVGADWQSKLGATLADSKFGGEVKLEITRILLYSLLAPSSAAFSHSDLLDQVLAMLSKAGSDDSASWSGWVCDLDGSKKVGRPSLSVAVWALLTSGGATWLGVFDRLASKAQLDTLASLVISSFHSPLVASPLVTLHSLTTSLLRLPSFYELPALRLSILSSIDLFTNDASAAPTLLATRPYEVLLVLPVEYIPRAQRLELVGRALRLEKALKITPGKGKDEREGGERARAILRRFAANVGEEMSGSGGLIIEEPIVDFLMMQSPFDELHPSASLRPVLEDATSSLLSNAFRSIVKYAAPESLARVVGKAFHEDVHGPFQDAVLDRDAEMDDDAEDESSNELDFPIKSCLLLLQAIKDECRDPKSLSEDLKLAERVATFHKTLQEGLELYDHVDVVRALTITKAFLAWLGVESHDLVGTITLPRKLVRICLDLPISASTDSSASTGLISAVLLYNAAELQSMPAGAKDRQSAVDLFMATWVALGAKLLSHGWDLDALRPSLVAYSKALSAAERTNILISLGQTLGSEGVSRRILEASAQAANLILKDGSEVANRSVISGLLSAFGEIVERLPSWDLLSTIITIVETICSDKAAHLQLADVCLIWSIISRSLAPRTSSPTPSPSTLPQLYLSITSSTTSLIRHRRDLVASTAPHLSAIVTQLIWCLRSTRPNLGGRQTRSVVETLPGWINVLSQPLGTEEARSLARLLTSLTAKTIPRTHAQPSSKAIKAESLATPLSKHAPFLLLAYVRLLTDLNSVVPSLMRRELEPGVGALCQMVGEKDRDAIMIGGGLDGGGKGVLKMVWAEWESGRYVGKG